MEDGTWKHFEFQSSNEGVKGLKRFRAYESLTSYQHNVIVETYVLFSGNIQNPMTEFTEGQNTYRIIPIIMKHKNADKLLASLEQKQKNGEMITKADLEKLKEEISMTRLGQMIWEDGIAEGEVRGKIEGRISAYLEMLRDGFITEAEVAHRLNMTQEELDILLNKALV